MFYNERVYLQSIDLVDRRRNEERLSLGKVVRVRIRNQQIQQIIISSIRLFLMYRICLRGIAQRNWDIFLYGLVIPDLKPGSGSSLKNIRYSVFNLKSNSIFIQIGNLGGV